MSEIEDKIYIEEDKPEIDLTNWLNSVSNLPEVWEKILNELLDNRYGVFTYNYEDAMVRETSDNSILAKPYSVKMRISICSACPDDMTPDEYDKYYRTLKELSDEQKNRWNKLTTIFKLFDEYLFNGKIDIEKVKKCLDKLTTVIESINAQAQRRATEDILDRMDQVLDGNQMMQLNRVLNQEFGKVTLCMKKEDIHLDYMNENIHVVKEFFKAKSVEGLSQRTLYYYKDIYNSFFTFIH